MSHWFHRSTLKATSLISYDNVFHGSFNLTKLASELKKCRDRLLDILPDASNSIETINNLFVSYLSIMCGFFMDYKISGKKIRYALRYKWTHTLLGPKPEVQEDVAFDISNMAVNTAIWLMKHAAYIASQKTVTMNDAKEIHTSLKKASGIFQLVLRDIVPMIEQTTHGSDLDPRVLNAFYYQCSAEAHEVTVARAIELNYSNTLISALANETSHLFSNSKVYLKDLNKSISEQWQLYLEIKKQIYLAYAYCYSGKHLMIENHCGEAIRALKESQSCYNTALALCKTYSTVKGPVKPVRPDGHLFFTVINSTVTSLLEKCERENGFIYHQKVPEIPVDLEMKSEHGLSNPETYNLPSPVPLWESAFDNQNELPPLKSLALKSNFEEKNLTSVEEKNVSDVFKEPQNDHGCIIH